MELLGTNATTIHSFFKLTELAKINTPHCPLVDFFTFSNWPWSDGFCFLFNVVKRSVIIVNAVSGKEAIHLTGSACDFRAVKYLGETHCPYHTTLQRCYYHVCM